MNRTLILALVAGLCVPVATSALAKGDTPARPDSSPKGTINVSCYRGALKTVAWDRPNAVFIEDLRKVGYSYEEATNIGERVCRDEWGVDNPEHKIDTLRQILRETPPHR